MKEYTKEEFAHKMRWVGGFEQMADYAGRVIVKDDPEFTAEWKAFCEALGKVDKMFDAWGIEDE